MRLEILKEENEMGGSHYVIHLIERHDPFKSVPLDISAHYLRCSAVLYCVTSLKIKKLKNCNLTCMLCMCGFCTCTIHTLVANSLLCTCRFKHVHVCIMICIFFV